MAVWITACTALLSSRTWAGPEPADGADTQQAEDRASAEYDRHLEAGIKLYEAGQYDPAIQEFEAAFTLQRQPSPLVNMALCYEKLDSPEHPHPTAVPTAIAKLEQVLADFGSDLPRERRAAVEAKLAELTPLVGRLAIRVEPTDAAVSIGGQRQPPAVLRAPLPVRSGKWTVRAELDGFAPAETTAHVTSGTTSSVALELEPTTGELVVVPFAKDAYVEIDGGALVQGRWQGRLAPGTHEIRVFRSGEPPQSLRIVVVAGKSHTVTQIQTGALETDAPAVGNADRPRRPRKLRHRRQPAAEEPAYTGWRVGASSAILAAIHRQRVDEYFEWEPAEHAPVGVALALRGGYRALEWLGFEARFEYGVIWGDGEVQWLPTSGAPQGGGYHAADYTLQTWRLLGGLETVYPWDSTVRFVGMASTGPVLSKIAWDEEGAGFAQLTDASGIDFAVGIDVGAELKLDRIVLDLVIQNVLQTTRGLEPDAASESAFDNGLIWYIGPAIRPGYELF